MKPDVRTTTARATTPPGSGGRRLILVALAYLGLATGLPEVADIRLGTSLNLVIALGLAWIGWHGLSVWPALRTYLRCAFALSVWIGVSSIAAWDRSAVYWSITTAVWLLFIVPGVANLLRHQSNRKAYMIGAVAAALTYAFTGLLRLATGRELFDVPVPSRRRLLGVKRGHVNAYYLLVIPFLVANAPTLARRLRWVAAAALVAGIVVSGGRAGLVALAIGVLGYAVLRNRTSQRLRALLTAALLGLVLVTAVGAFGGQAVEGKNRLVSYIRGERTSSDDKHEAWLKRAWHVGVDNPVFGIGYRHLEGLPHEALDIIRNRQGREEAQEGGAHNTYAQMFAEFGAPGALAFILLLGSLLRLAWRHKDRREVLAAGSGVVGLMVVMLFDPITLSFLFLPIAYLVGAVGDLDADHHERRALAGTSGDVA